jgi:aspartyl-tRNA(Asn)/glutamyl-tRNA(Gln) amidotransferase subunit B
MKLVQAELVNQGVSDADMEKGHLRCDANISISQISNLKSQNSDRKCKMSEIVEIKNINSFRFVEKALAYEEKRLRESFPNWPEKRTKVTRGFNSQTGETYEQRRKEEAADYRYFPEPDLPPINAEKLIPLAKEHLKEPIDKKLEKLEMAAGLSSDEATKVLTDKSLRDVIWSRIDTRYISALSKLLVHNPDLAGKDIKSLVRYAEAITEGKISASLAKQKLTKGEEFSEPETADTSELEQFAVKLMKDNPDAVNRYKSGKTNLIGFFVGQAMQNFKGKFEPKIVNEIIRKELEK